MTRIDTYRVSTFVLAFALGMTPPAMRGADRQVSSCSVRDVQSAVNDAASGDRILLPQGTCTWATTVTIPSGKKLVVEGAPDFGTVIMIAPALLTAGLDLGNSASRVTRLRFVLNAPGSIMSGQEAVRARGNGFRVDHNRFENGVAPAPQRGAELAVHITGTATTAHLLTGVIDHNIFKETRIYIQADSSLLANTTWSQPSHIGNPDQTGVVYIEDNAFDKTLTGVSVVDCQFGGAYVFRHNEVVNSGLEVHSNQTNSSGADRAPRSWEIYDNTFKSTRNFFAAMFLRGGTGVVFNNKIDGDFGVAIALDNVRSFSDRGGPNGKCDGTAKVDGNVSGGWPCRDQIGRGQDEPGPFPQHQASEPAYFWNNTRNGSAVQPYIHNCSNTVKPKGSCADILAGRDFLTSPRPGYSSYTYPHPLATDR